MKWLLWKDYRVNRLVFIAALVLLVLPHALAAVLAIRAMGWRLGGDVPAHYFVESSVSSVVVLQLMLAFVGGNAIAGERVDRSAEFFAYIPVTRRRAVVSKLLVSLAVLSLIWLPNLVILALGAAGVSPEDRLRFLPPWPLLPTVAITGLTFFCVAWLLSSMLESPTFSVCTGLIVPFLVWMGTIWTVHLLKLDRWPYELNAETFFGWYWGLCLAISAACFPVGTLYYLRRVEP
jgi:ABC-type transport system involved in multi-copper enzyme maturation permease subunit